MLKCDMKRRYGEIVEYHMWFLIAEHYVKKHISKFFWVCEAPWYPHGGNQGFAVRLCHCEERKC